MKKRRLVRIVLYVIVSVAMWFLVVDLSWFMEECADCRSRSGIMQIRLFTLPIYEKRMEHPSLIELIAKDLGVPCMHNDVDLWNRSQIGRWWGLLIPSRSYAGYIVWFGDGDLWYDDSFAAKVKAIAAREPSVTQDFAQQVLGRMNRNYWQRFLLELRNDDAERIVLAGKGLPQDRISTIVDGIRDVKWLLPDGDALQSDQNAALILTLGDKAAPYLVEQIANEQPSQWLSWGTRGDVAHILLTFICRRAWPTNDFQEKHGLESETPFYEYHARYLAKENEESRANRRELQAAWETIFLTMRHEI